MSGLVKYSVDHINDDIKELSSISTGSKEIIEIQDATAGISAVWDTVGGAIKIKGLSNEVNQLDSSKIDAAVQSLSSGEVQYSKEEVYDRIVFKS